MPNKTEPILDLVDDVLHTFSKPYHEDIIEDVFLAIEHHRDWRSCYDELSAQLDQDVVNNWIGRYVRERTHMRAVRQVASNRSTITTSYTKLAR